MKKIALVLVVMMAGQYAISQNKFRFGLKLGPAVNWMKPDDVKKFENDGATVGFNWGLQAEYALSDNFSFYSGLELNQERGKINFAPSDNSSLVGYFMDDEYNFSTLKEENGIYSPEDTSAYGIRLLNRTYKSTYVTLPIGMKMKTNEIGYMTYFGEFGLNIAFRTGTKITDEVDYMGNVAAKANLSDIRDVNIDKDMQPVRIQLRVGAGAEYKISEGTSVFGAIHYNLGFTNSVKKDSKLMLNEKDPGVFKPLSQKFTAHGIAVTIGVLF